MSPSSLQKLISGLLHACDAGKEPCNQGKNRYKNIIPCERSFSPLRRVAHGHGEEVAAALALAGPCWGWVQLFSFAEPWGSLFYEGEATAI